MQNERFLTMSMTVQAVGVNAYSAPKMKQAAFKGKKTEAPEVAEAPKQKKHLGKAIASFFVTGLGQMFDGRFGTGLKQMLISAGCGLAAKFLAVAALASKTKVGAVVAGIGSAAAGIGVIANAIHSVIDAYNGGKKA